MFLRELLAVMLVVLLSAQVAHCDAAVVRLGMSAAFSGHAAALGTAYYRGAYAAFSEVNRRGGVHGRLIELVPLDDAYDPKRTVHNLVNLVEEHKVDALFGFVGTPTVTRILPLLQHFPDGDLLLFFPYTGAHSLSEQAIARNVFRLRTSYSHEISAAVEALVGVGRNRFAVFHQADAYGRSGWADLRATLKAHGLEMVAEATYTRATVTDDSDYSLQVATLLNTSPDVIFCIGTAASCAAFTYKVRDGGCDVPVVMPSFVPIEDMLARLAQHGKVADKGYTDNLVFIGVMPQWNDLRLPLANEYRKAVSEFADPPMPDGAWDVYTKLDDVGFEGYIAARTVVRLLEGTQGSLDAGLLRQQWARLNGSDIGGKVLHTTGRRLGLDLVRFTTVRNGALAPLHDFARWSQ